MYPSKAKGSSASSPIPSSSSNPSSVVTFRRKRSRLQVEREEEEYDRRWDELVTSDIKKESDKEVAIEGVKTIVERSSCPPTKKSKAKDLRSFFSPAAQSTLKSDCTDSSIKQKVKLSKDSKELHQLQILTSSPTAITCPTCQMSYVKTSTLDRTAHDKFCARFKSGVDWKLADCSPDSAKFVKVIKEWKDDKIVVVEGLGKGRERAKVQLLLDLVEHALTSSPLSQEQLKESKSYIYISKSKKAVGICVAYRVQKCFRVLPIRSISPITTDATNTNVGKPSTTLEQPIQPDPQSSLLCSPTPSSCILGISRLLVLPTHRRQGIATKLLDACVENFIYNLPLGKRPEERRRDVAWSQPSADGERIARRWYQDQGEGGWGVFVE